MTQVHETSLHSMMIVDMIASHPETDSPITDKGIELTVSNQKMALAIAYGAKTTKCSQYITMDEIVKTQLYSRDMAGCTTSIIDSIPFPSNSMNCTEEEYKAHRRMRALHSVMRYARTSTGPNNLFLQNLFHMRVTK